MAADQLGNTAPVRWRRLLVAVGSAPVLWGAYLLLEYPPPTVELWVGAGVDLFAAVGLATAYTVLWPGYRVDRELLARTARLPGEVVRDFAVITVQLVIAGAHGRQVAGSARWVPCPDDGVEALVRGRRAATAVVESLAANTVVVGFDQDGKRMLIHELRPTAPPGEAVGATATP